jgi:endo-1,4-beta-xylanase
MNDTNSPIPLGKIAQSGGRYFGAAVRMDQLAADRKLRELVIRDCSYLVPEIHLYWICLEWSKGHYNFNPVDELLYFADKHEKTVRGHTLIWEQGTPEWAKVEIRENKNWDLIDNHFSKILGRYQDQITEWIVVNEPIDTVGGDENGLRNNTFRRAFGEDYIEHALISARNHAPKARLFLNEYGFDYENPTDEARRQAFLALVRRLKDNDVPLDGVGLQAHLDLSKGKLADKELRSFVRGLAQTGVDVTISELDVKEKDHDAPLDKRDKRVADEAQHFLDIVLAESSVRGVVTWGLSDRHSWLTENPTQAQIGPDGSVLLNRGLPYDGQYRPKPMYWAISQALNG